ncbi:MAG: hypothetical protein ACHQT5_01795 [Candidatus Saccharimonadales bacterium]|jgi:hypothetical protein
MAITFPEDVQGTGEIAEVVRQDAYVHITATELTQPEFVAEALKIQGEGYQKFGYVGEDGIEQDGPLKGALIPELDKSRGPYTDYYLAINPDTSRPNDAATMRKRHLAPGETFDDLPTGALARQSLTAEGKALIDSVENPDLHFKELGGLAGNPRGVYEIIRARIQEARGKEETWFFSIVSSTFDTMVRRYGQSNFTVIGENIALDDVRVNDGISMVPAIVYPDRFIENVLGDFRVAQVEGDVTAQRELRKSFLYLTDGLNEQSLGAEMYAARDELTQMQPVRSK